MILMYHHIAEQPGPNAVAVAAWQGHMAYLKAAGYHVLDMDAYLTKILAGSLQARELAITFDDAYSSFVAHALPVLQAQGFPATVFMPVDFAGKSNVWDDGAYPILDWPALRELSQVAGITVGSHGRSHRRLRSLSQADIMAEAQTSKEELEWQLGLPVRHFAYPYGQLRDYDRRCMQALAHTGFASGCATIWGRHNGPRHQYALHRLEITPDDDVKAFAAKVSRDLHPRFFRQRIKNMLFHLHLRR